MRTRWLLLAGLVLSACAPQPNSYEDCILRYEKPGLSSAAAVAVREACRAKFPWTADSELLPAEALAKLKVEQLAKLALPNYCKSFMSLVEQKMSKRLLPTKAIETI